MLRPIVSRFPASELADRTSSGDYIRVVATVQDYARKTGTCFASDQTIADQLGLSRGGVNRLIARAEARGVITSRPNPDRGTMDRQVAPITADTLVVCVSAHARSALAGTRFKVYGLLVLRQHLDEETTIARIAADCALTENTARAAVADLVADGWVSREGDNGCAHRFRTHPVPIAGVPTQDALFPQPRQQARPADNTTAIQAEDAPTGPADPGQLPLFTDPPPAPTPPVPVTGTPLDPVTATPPVPVTRTRSPYQDLPNRQSARGGDGSGEAATSVPRARADRPATTRPATARAGLVAPSADPRKTPAPPPTTALPPLTVSAEVHQVLRQVPSLVARMSRWQQREAARAVGRAIRAADGDGPRVADRVLRRHALADEESVRDPYAWLVHLALARRGCHLASCESGTDLDLGGTCTACAYQVEGAKARSAARRQTRKPAPVPGARSAERSALGPALTAPQRTGQAEQQGLSPVRGGLPVETVPAWLPRMDTSAGAALREQLAARRQAREGAVR